MQQIQIIGNLGQDAEAVNFGGKEYTKFSLAVTEKKKNEKVTTWYYVLYQGSHLLQYLLKGTKVFVQGNIALSIYTSKSGTPQINASVYASRIELLTPKKESTSDTEPLILDDKLPF